MTIETKCNIGDEVWTLNSLCEPIPVKVFGIMVVEEFLFPTKEELLKSL